MAIDPHNLPLDTALLHQIIEDLMAEITSLEAQLALLKAKRFGKSSEKLDKQIEDLELLIEENETTTGGTKKKEGVAKKEKDKQKPKRQALPDHLPRENVVLEPDSKCPECGGEKFRKLADDISEVLEYVPASFKVMRYTRPRCVCTNCEKVVQAYAPSKPIAKGKAGPGLLAHISIQKYCNSLPLYRQSQMYKREGVILSRTTMAGWMGQCSNLLEPLVAEIQKSVFSSSHIHGDDTHVSVLAPGFGKTKTGRLWVYVRDGRPHGDTVPPAVCYFYSPDRKGERPAEHLKGFSGILHADAYSGYDRLYDTERNKQGTVEEAACWAHTRRKFYEANVVTDKASIAIETLVKIAKIYRIEDMVNGLPPDQRLEKRQQESKVLVHDLFTWWRNIRDKLPKKSETSKAIGYALNHEKALLRFLDDGKIELDNNAAERAMRTIAIGRKNWLFAGSDNGGRTAANLYSITETAKLNNIDPQAYLHKVLSIIQDYNARKIEDLLPWNLKLH